MISSLNVNISRESLFLIDIYIITLFVLMSFDNYIYLMLKRVDSYLSILNICEVAVLFGLYCVMCWTGTFVIFLPEIYYCVVGRFQVNMIQFGARGNKSWFFYN